MKKIIFALVILFLHEGILTAQCFTADASIWENTWASCSASENPKSEYGQSHWIQYDLGFERRLSKSWIWNTNDPNELDQGFKDVHIDYSLDGQSWTYWGQMTFPQGTGTAVYGGFPGPDLVGIQARHILITAIDNYGDPSCYGLAEVKFNLLPSPPGSTPDDTYENCVAVSEAEAVVTGPTQALISWEPIEDIENYLVEYRLQGTEDWIQALDDFSEAYLENLIPLETYEYRITSLCFSEISEAVTGTFTLSEEALCPNAEDVLLILEEIGPDEAFIYWDIEGIIPESMTVTIYQEGAPPSEWTTIETNEPEIFLADLDPSTEYVLFISWTCGNQTIISDELYFTTIEAGGGFCQTIYDINIESVDYTTASFSWAPSPNTSVYFVEYTLEDEDDWTRIETTSPNITLNNLVEEAGYLLIVGFPCGENILWSEPIYFETDPLLSTSTLSGEQRLIHTFPNPTRGPIGIQYTSNRQESLQYELVSPIGQVLETGLWNHIGGEQQYGLNIRGQVDGVYFIRLLVDGHIPLGTQRIVKIGN